MEPTTDLAALISIASDLGEQHIENASRYDGADHPDDIRDALGRAWPTYLKIVADFAGAIGSWLSEAAAAGDTETVQWARAVLDLEGDELAAVRNAYIDGAGAAAFAVAGPRLYGAINKSDRLGTPVWTAEPTPVAALAKAEREAGLNPDSLEVVPIGPRLMRLIDRGHYAPETRWELTDDGVAELRDWI